MFLESVYEKQFLKLAFNALVQFMQCCYWHLAFELKIRIVSHLLYKIPNTKHVYVILVSQVFLDIISMQHCSCHRKIIIDVKYTPNSKQSSWLTIIIIKIIRTQLSKTLYFVLYM